MTATSIAERRTLAATARRTLPNRVAYALAAGVIGLGLFASVTPSPLYHLYAIRWHFGPLTLTLVYATYAFGVLAALLLAGRVSDEVGRRPVLLVSLAALALSSVTFIVASSPAWLFAARGLQGLATGAAISAAGAALLDLHPRRDAAAVGLANGVASAAGLALGFLVSSALVQLGDAPRTLPYLVLFTLFAIAFIGAYFMPEPVEDRRRLRLTVARPSVPASARRPFVLASLAVLSSWSIGGLFFSLGPGLGSRLFDTTNAILAGIGIVVLAGSAAIGQLVLGRIAPWVGASAGSVALAAGTVLIVSSAAIDSRSLFLAGAVIGGIGFGIAFLGGLRSLVASIPPHERAAVLSAFYIVAYASLSIPAVLAGVAVTHVGLTTTFETFGSVVAALALVVAFEAWRTRPTQI
jgi:predicted MFS family arabinose efflux permease